MFAYLFDEALHQQLNSQGCNYWDVYIEEMSRLLGAKACKLSPYQIASSDIMKEVRVLIVGRQSSDILNAAVRDSLVQWVESGGILIGFAVQNLDEVFGIKPCGLIKQTPDDYTISAHFDLRPHPLTHEVHPMMFMEQKLLAVSDVLCVKPAEQTKPGDESAVELAHLYDTQGVDLGFAAITWRKCGEGYAGYFAFDVAQTIWVLHQGRPIPADVKQTRRYPRAFDLCVLGNNSRKIPYADELSFVLQNMIAQSRLPFVYQIPPKDGKVADALLYWGGDEYVGPTELSLKSSDWMKAKSLPYHINLEAENHPMTPAESQHILDNGHELSEYYHMLEADGWAAYEELYIRQSNEFYERFGYRPITSVNCVLRWNGWADTARWMEKAHSQADNSISGHPITLGHPLANGPFFGFGAATTYPFFFYDNYDYANRKIDIIEQPIVCYEMGHRGSLLDNETAATEDVHLPIEMAIKYHMVMNMFYHPIYIAKYPQCRAAIEELLATIERRGANVVHMGNDALNDWWRKRADATLENLVDNGFSVEFKSHCDYADGMAVKLLAKRQVSTVTMDGRWLAEYELRKEFAGHWLYIVLPQGTHTIKVVCE